MKQRQNGGQYGGVFVRIGDHDGDSLCHGHLLHHHGSARQMCEADVAEETSEVGTNSIPRPLVDESVVVSDRVFLRLVPVDAARRLFPRMLLANG